MTGFVALIPARLASTRLPDKPLADLGGRPMVVRVAERARAAGATRVAVATDSPRIIEAVRAAGFEAIATRADHPSGTDRLAEVVERLGWADDSIVVNVQGDEPLMPPTLIRQVADNLAAHPEAAIATLGTPIEDATEFFDPNAVKVVADRQGLALYFSRAPIPWDRDGFARSRERLPPAIPHRRHLGLYAYRAAFLRAYRDLEPAPLERSEMLEQLRALWHGYRIHVADAVVRPGPGVDVEADAQRVEALLKALET